MGQGFGRLAKGDGDGSQKGFKRVKEEGPVRENTEPSEYWICSFRSGWPKEDHGRSSIFIPLW